MVILGRAVVAPIKLFQYNKEATTMETLTFLKSIVLPSCRKYHCGDDVNDGDVHDPTR